MLFLTGLTIAGGAAVLGTGVYKTRQHKGRLVDFLQNVRHPKQATAEPMAEQTDIQPTDPTKTQPEFVGNNRRTIFLASGGIILASAVGGGLWLMSAAGLTPLVLTNQLILALRANPLSPYIFTGLYAIRPLTLFPPFLMSLAGGLLFGPVWGTILVMTGLNISAVVSYLVGRYFGEQFLDSENSVMERYIGWIRRKPFESVLTMHLLCLPYDLVNTLAGFMQVGWREFWIANAIGALPGALSITLLGASIEGSAITSVPHLNPVTLAASGAILAGSFIVSHYMNPYDLEQGEAVLEESSYEEMPLEGSAAYTWAAAPA